MNKVALLVFTEGFDREDVYQERKHFLEKELAVLFEKTRGHLQLYQPHPPVIRDKATLKNAIADIMQHSDICGCLLYTGTFINASNVTMAARLLNLPCVLLGNHHRRTVSLVGFFAAAGALSQAGLPFFRIDGDIRESGTLQKLCTFFSASNARKQLLGETFGMFGGRPLGISTATADSAQWLKLFGVDITHIDQLEIISRAEQVQPEQVCFYRDWIFKNYGNVCFQPNRFEEKHLERMIRSYLSIKSIISSYGLDFVGIKCQPDLSNGYVLQCLTVQLLNDPYDAEGPKEPVVCSCEADADGALTMEILKHITGGKPTALQDIFCFEEDRILVLANCGAGASHFAGYSSDPKENLKHVYLYPHGFGEAGGASTQFNFAPGINTYARLTRKNLQYHMLITRGRVLEKKREDLAAYSYYRPISVTELEVPASCLSSKLDSNHLLCVEGDYVEALTAFCQLYQIHCDVLVKSSAMAKELF